MPSVDTGCSSSLGDDRDLVDLEQKLAEGDINPGVWLCYFPNYDSTSLPSCQDCEAYPVCKYAHDKEPLKCFTTPGRHYR